MNRYLVNRLLHSFLQIVFDLALPCLAVMGYGYGMAGAKGIFHGVTIWMLAFLGVLSLIPYDVQITTRAMTPWPWWMSPLATMGVCVLYEHPMYGLLWLSNVILVKALHEDDGCRARNGKESNL